LNTLVNPYHAGRPAEDPEMFFGRDDALIWTEQQLALDRRLLIVHGPDLIGKTSLVLRLPAFLGEHTYCVYFEGKPHQGRPLPQVLAALAGDVAKQLMSRNLVSPHQVDTASDAAMAIKSLLGQAVLTLDARGSLEETARLVLVLDDAHRLADGRPPSLDGLLDFLATLLANVPRLQLLVTLSNLTYVHLNHPILLGAEAFRLGPLGSDAAQQLITRPAQGALRFDAGVTKRIADITSNHPYYLHLFCYTLYNLCARDAWVNQSDIDRVLDTLLALPNKGFQFVWDQSTWAEQAALTALARRRGAHGPITRQEVINYLRRFDPRVVPDVILDALESLADRGVLVRMGALSYRFAVDLFRYWLDRYTDPAEVLAGVNWSQPGTKPARRASPEQVEVAEVSPRPGETMDEGDVKRRWNPGIASILGLTGTALIGLVLLALAFGGMLTSGAADMTPTTVQSQMIASGFVSPTPTANPAPVATPTPTRPLVVARSLPAIVYMARSVGGTPLATWQIFVMDADGTNRQQRTESNADNIMPVWSPNGQRIAFVSQRDGNRDIYLINRDGTGLVNLTQHPAEDWTPAWSPDGQQIAFSSNRQGNWEIFLVNTDGTNLRQITSDGAGNLSPVWSADGQTMAFSSKRDGNWEIYTMPTPDSQGQAGGIPRRLTFSEGNDLSPLFAPRGDRIAFESNRDGDVEIYVMNADGSGQQNLTRLPLADDHGPVWSPDGQWLMFYSNREGNWDLFIMTATGDQVVNLTNSPDMDEQAPTWRP
jgi:WD40 repeat protein